MGQLDRLQRKVSMLQKEMTQNHRSRCLPPELFSSHHLSLRKPVLLLFSKPQKGQWELRCDSTNCTLWHAGREVADKTTRTSVKDCKFRFRFFIHQVIQQGKCLESGKHTNISKQQHWHTSISNPFVLTKQHPNAHLHDTASPNVEQRASRTVRVEGVEICDATAP